MRVLYLPIYDPSHHAVALANKTGLRDALLRAGHEVKEVDYCAIKERDFAEFFELELALKYELVISQFQGTNYIDFGLASEMRYLYPNLKWVNFNQDYWPEHHTTPDMLALLRHVNLQLVSNGSVLPDYAANGVNAAYWPFGYEVPNRPLPDVPHHDIVFLGNAYSEHRRKLGKWLKTTFRDVGLYGTGWENGDGDCNYDFTYGEALYKNATVAISDNEFTDAVGYLSNRPFQILAAGGALMLQQKVERLEEFTGLQENVHYAGYSDYLSLYETLNHIFDPLYTELNKRTVQAGQAFVREHHSYDVRVRELMAMVEGLKV